MRAGIGNPFSCRDTGFEHLRRFTILGDPSHPELVFLQSLETAELCFLAVPVNLLRPDYQLQICDEDLELLGAEACGPALRGLARAGWPRDPPQSRRIHPDWRRGRDRSDRVRGNESIARDEERIDRLRAQMEARMAAADAAIAALEQKANYISSVFTAMAQAQENSR